MDKLSLLIFFTFLCGVLGNSTYYSSYFGRPLSSEDVNKYSANGTLANCTISVEDCNQNEGRRVDGTCNNIKNPSYGAPRTPYYRLLPADYDHPSPSVYNPSLSRSGKPKPPPRNVRTKIYAEGRIADRYLTSAVNHMNVVFATDITNTRDTSNYLSWRPYCCKPEGAQDYACAPNIVPADDPVHRFSGVRCLNMTRPLTFQTSGCLPNTTTPMRIVDATPLIDLSPVYGNVGDKARRTSVGGRLVTITVNNREFPDTSNINLLLGINFIGIILFWRNHNFIADNMAQQNPCWDDDKLFQIARDINIGYGIQIFYYELMATMLGKDNLIKDGILSANASHRDVYDENVLPRISLEYPVALRSLHSMQEGDLRMYHANGTYKSKVPVVDLTANTTFLQVGSTMDEVIQGIFRQPSGKVDDLIADPDIVEKGLSSLQFVNDIMTNDLAKNRHFGFQGYTKYRQYCFGDEITSFEDLSGIIDPEVISLLKELYESVDEIDLLVGIWVEKKMSGTFVGPTFYCIVSKQLKRNLLSDRHWPERANRTGAFTESQLAEVRKASMARLLCDIGGGVTEIQPNAFQLPSDKNPIGSCDKIPALDFSKWKECA